MVIYQKREINLLAGRTPACGSLHGFPQQTSNVLFAHEFGSCLAKLNNVNAFPKDARDRVTLAPGTSYRDDQANVEFALSDALVLSIKGTAKSRTVVSLEAIIDVGMGGSPASVQLGEQLLTVPIDLHLFTPDGKHVGPKYGTDEYEIGIDQARAGGAYTATQWISLPDDVPAWYIVDASQGVANAKAFGLQKLDIEATVSIRHYDANGVEGELRAPVSFKLSLDQTTTGRIDIPLPGAAGSDTIAPATAASLSPQPNAAGWNNSNVTLALTATDNPGGSGLKQITLSASGAQSIASTSVNGSSASIVISNEGFTTITFFATDNAGNAESVKSLMIRLDKTPPSISCAGTDGLWHASDVSIPCVATDSGSGLANPSDAGFSLSTSVPAGTETANAATSNRQVCDVAGNCSAAGPVAGNMIDKKPPSISITSPTASSYLLNQAVNANYACLDGGSGVATCAGTVASGARIDTSFVGSNNVGNVTPTQSVSYSVTYGLCLLYDPSRAVQSGSTVPLKIQLCDANNADASNSTIVVHAVSLVQTGTDASETLQASGSANPDNDFRFDSTLGPTGGYIFNLSTKGRTTGSYLLTFTAGADPSSHPLMFQVR